MWLFITIIFIIIFIDIIKYNFTKKGKEKKEFNKALKNYRNELYKEKEKNRKEFINQWKDKK